MKKILQSAPLKALCRIRQLLTEGHRIATEVALRSLPLVSKADGASLEAMKSLDIPLLLVTLDDEGSHTERDVLEEVASRLHGRYFVSTTSEPSVSERKSYRSEGLPLVAVFSKLDDATPVYRGSFKTETLLEFADMSLSPLMPKLTTLSRLVTLMKTGLPLGLLLTDDAAERRFIVESLGGLAAQYRGRINMATVDATELPFLAEPLGVDPGKYPAFVLQSQDDACIHNQNLLITKKSIEDLILDCLEDISGS